nr:hypothetical protein [Dermatophilaceae bacterium]
MIPQRWPNLSGRATRIRATAARRFSAAGAALTRTLVFGELGATWDDPTVTWDDPAWSWDGQPVPPASGGTTLRPTAIPSAEAVGSPTITVTATISPTGVASGQAL